MSSHDHEEAVEIDPARVVVHTGKLKTIFLALAALGIIGCAVAWATDARQFYYSYLTAYVWGATIVLGMLFFVMLHHVTDAGWSAVIRRPAEQVLAAIPLVAILLIPVVIGAASGDLFNWVKDDPGNKLLAWKRPYLNLPFFYVRQVFYVLVWLWLVRVMRGRSLKQDVTGDPQLSLSMRRWSAPGMVLFALTFTMASFDWLMSLDYHWFSTIFGVYTFAGAVCTALAVLSLMILALSKGPLAGMVSRHTLHSVGMLWWAFVVFWAYIAFSQYFLIWYANIPEETMWFLHRWTGVEAPFDVNWWIASMILPSGMFVIPFVCMMSAHAKRNPRVLTLMAIITLVTHWVDCWWMVSPVLHPHAMPLETLWVDLAGVLAVGGLLGWAVARALEQAPACPLHDPRLNEALAGGHHEEDDDDDLPQATVAGEAR